MGKRCRVAALGATFALLVAACAAPNTSVTRAGRSDATSPSPSSAGEVSVTTAGELPLPETLTFPESLADASFARPPSDGTCQTTHLSSITLHDSQTGAQRWAVPIPRPGDSSTIDRSSLFFSFTWDQDQQPGLGAVDIGTGAPLWQRFLAAEPQDLRVVDGALIVVSRNDVRALDPVTGEDVWVMDSQFDFSSVVVGTEFVFALNRVGVHAIDAASGDVEWQLAIERPDTLAASDETLAVASGTRLIGVDIDAQRRVFDIDVDRIGSGDLWVASTSVVHELSTTVAPGGGLAAIDFAGVERWRNLNIGEPVFAGQDVVIASTANQEPSPGAPFVLFAADANTGVELWRQASTAQVFEAVIGTTDDRVAITQPHQVVPGLHSSTLLDLHTGEAVWESATDLRADGATIEVADLVAVYSSRRTGDGTRQGSVALRGPFGQWWRATTPEIVAQPPLLTGDGLVVVSGARSSLCIGRSVGEPS